MRVEWAPLIEPAIARASTVFAVPGTSSSSAWPRHMRAATTSLICSRFPCTTVSMLSRNRSATSVAELSSSVLTHDLPFRGAYVDSTVRRRSGDLDCLCVLGDIALGCNGGERPVETLAPVEQRL